MRYLGALAGLAVLVALVGIASDSRAGQVVVDFDFSGSSIVLPSLASIPPDGTITSAGASFTIPAAGPVTVSAGPAELDAFEIRASVDVVFGGFPSTTSISGSVTQSQQGSALGNFVGGGIQGIASLQTVQLFTRIALDCDGGILNQCNSLGLPATSSGTSTVQALSFVINNLGVSGGATIMKTITFSGSSGTGMIFLTGTETSRTFLPEPGHYTLMATGIAGLAGLSRLRRARR